MSISEPWQVLKPRQHEGSRTQSKGAAGGEQGHLPSPVISETEDKRSGSPTAWESPISRKVHRRPLGRLLQHKGTKGPYCGRNLPLLMPFGSI